MCGGGVALAGRIILFDVDMVFPYDNIETILFCSRFCPCYLLLASRCEMMMLCEGGIGRGRVSRGR